MEEHEAVKEKDVEIKKKDYREDVQLPAKFQNHRLTVLKMLKQFKSTWVGHLGRSKVARNWIEFLNDDRSSVHCTTYWPEQTARKFTAAENGRMINKKVMEPATNDWAPPTMFSAKKNSSLLF